MTITLDPGNATCCLTKGIICIAFIGFDKYGESVLYKLSGESEDLKKNTKTQIFSFFSPSSKFGWLVK